MKICPVDVFCYFLCKTNLPIKGQIWVFLNVFCFVLNAVFHHGLYDYRMYEYSSCSKIHAINSELNTAFEL